MFDDLDKTLGELLRRELSPSIAEQVSISFAAPDDQFPSSAVSLPAIDLFLYDIRENSELRSNEWSLHRDRQSLTYREFPPPVRVDCSYLVTAWASEGSSTMALDEHRLLGEVIGVLARFPTVPPDVLQGSLRGQDPPLPAISLQPGRLQSLGEFWQALGGKPKAAFYYTVTIRLAAEPRAGRLVKDDGRDIRLEKRTKVDIKKANVESRERKSDVTSS